MNPTAHHRVEQTCAPQSKTQIALQYKTSLQRCLTILMCKTVCAYAHMSRQKVLLNRQNSWSSPMKAALNRQMTCPEGQSVWATCKTCPSTHSMHSSGANSVIGTTANQQGPCCPGCTGPSRGTPEPMSQHRVHPDGEEQGVPAVTRS